MYDDEELVKIGAPIGAERPAVFELVISDHITFADPRSFGVDVEGINPAEYFVTSGDAVEKAKILERELWQHAGSVRKQTYAIIASERRCTLLKAQTLFRKGVRPKKPARFKDYETAVWKAAGQSRRLVQALIKARGESVFLETEWSDHKLLCIPKNPRSQPE